MFGTPKQALYTIVKEFGPIDIKPLFTVVESKFGAEAVAIAYAQLVNEGEITTTEDYLVAIMDKQ